MITPSRPGIERNASPYLYGKEAEAVSQVLESGQYGHSEITEEFEGRIADFLGVPDAVAVASGTAALHAALAATGVGPGDEVIVPSMTFCATIQAILAVGATPVFVDVDPDTLCTTDRIIMEFVTCRTRAVMPVLFGGRAIDLSHTHKDLTDQGITIIEDAAHAFGSHNGACRVGATGDLTCFSFGPIKNLTCGQGGMVVPRTPEEAQTLRRIRLLGVAQSQTERANTTSYRVESFGLRYQLSGLNAAIGLAQLDRFETTERTRQKLWLTYQSALSSMAGVTLVDADPERSVPHLCQVRVKKRDAVFARLRSQGVGVGVHYPPNHLQPAFRAWRRPLPATELVAEEILTLPFHQHLTDADIDHVTVLLGEAVAATSEG